MRTVVLITLATLALTACDAQDPVADGANDAAGQTDVVLPPDETAPIPANEVESEAGDPSASSAPSGTIPASLQGRWGLTPGDCTSTRGDAKGLLLVSGDMLRFYESVARPAGTLETSANSASGDFAFTGEGMNWKKYEALELQDGKLVRTESDPMASFTYARCAS